MWIAKPFHALSQVELRQWIHCCSWRRRLGEDVPLSQTLSWARAASLACEVYGVFDPAENVGGLVFELRGGLSGARGHRFECVNGPLLDWDCQEKAPRQVATFALAVSKLRGGFDSLALRPRWTPEEAARRLPWVPLEIGTRNRASTVILNLQSDWQQAFSSRLKRTIRISERALREVSWKRLEGDRIQEFLERGLPALRALGEKRGFQVPEERWFQLLLGSNRESDWVSQAEGVQFFESRAKVEEVESRLLIALHGRAQGSRAYYLFGAETRPEGARSAWSAQAIAQREAMIQCSALGAASYDFNGYLRPEVRTEVRDEEGASPYDGVARFKEQFGGVVKDYEIPEFQIT